MSSPEPVASRRALKLPAAPLLLDRTATASRPSHSNDLPSLLTSACSNPTRRYTTPFFPARSINSVTIYSHVQDKGRR